MGDMKSLSPLSYFFIAFTGILWTYIVILFLFGGGTESIYVERFPWSGNDGRVLIIGSVHGCFKELQQLVKSSSYREDRDTFIFLGDMIGEGPSSAQVVQFAMDHNAQCIRGPLEDQIHAWYILDDDKRPPLDPQLSKLVEQLSEDQMNFIIDCAIDIELSKYNSRVIHSGINVKKDLEVQREDILIKLGESGGIIKNRVSDWIGDWKGPELIVYDSDGKQFSSQPKYSPAQELVAVGVDSGVLYGNYLSAFALPEMKILRVSARNQYKQ